MNDILIQGCRDLWKATRSERKGTWKLIMLLNENEDEKVEGRRGCGVRAEMENSTARTAQSSRNCFLMSLTKPFILILETLFKIKSLVSILRLLWWKRPDVSGILRPCISKGYNNMHNRKTKSTTNTRTHTLTISTRPVRETLPATEHTTAERQDPPAFMGYEHVQQRLTRSYSQQKERRRHAPASGASRSTSVRKAGQDPSAPAEVTAICGSAGGGQGEAELSRHVLGLLLFLSLSFICYFFYSREKTPTIGGYYLVILESHVVFTNLFICFVFWSFLLKPNGDSAEDLRQRQISFAVLKVNGEGRTHLYE